MAKNILNGYAIKAFSEHPSALWPLDDDVFFLSLIPDSSRLFTNWQTPVNATVIDYTDPSFLYPEILSPFNSDDYSMIEGQSIPSPIYISNISGDGTLITYTTSSNHGLSIGQNVSIIGTNPAQYSKTGVTVYSTPSTTSFTIQSPETGSYVSGGEVRYSLDITVDSNIVFSNSQIDSDKPSFCINQYIYQDCIYVNYYEVGYSYKDSLNVTHEVVNRIVTSQNGNWINFNHVYEIPSDSPTDFKLIFRVSVTTGGVDSDYRFYMNALSVGQWSEVSSSRSLGSQDSALPQDTGLVLNGVRADQYGILSNNAYYVVENNRLLSQNNNSPMIFGTESLTRINASSSGNPSLIFPGMGMLNESGRYKNQTLEMWMRIKPNTKESRRILGPLDGDYGVYVRDNNISLVIGNNFGSHYISQWYRPMLLNIIINNNNASLLINGERVISIDINRSTLSLPNSFDELNYGPDWWGIFSYSDIEGFDVDCISIYPYSMSDQIAKKHFVWGQGTPSITSINNQYMGTSVYFDYSNANYSVNAVYPDAYNWGSGYFNNLIATKNSLSTPDYSLPEIYLQGRDLQEWYAANKEFNESEYPDPNHPRFITFRPTPDEDNWNENCYLYFENLNILIEPISAIYGVFEVKDDIDIERPLILFRNSVSGSTFSIGVKRSDIYYRLNGNAIYINSITLDEHFAIGINFQNLASYFGNQFLDFFSFPSYIQMYIGGDGETTFEGKIYRVGFSNQYNYQEIDDLFLNNGIAIASGDEVFTEHFASYTLMPIYRFNRLFLDISVSSQWEEYYPLSYFSKVVFDEEGNQYYDLDMMQMNIDYSPINSIVGGKFDTSNSPLKTYVTFQSIIGGANDPISNYPVTESLSQNRVIDANSFSDFDAYNRKFEFLNNSVIIPPKTVNIENIAMTVFFDIKQEGIISNPIKIRNFEICSNAFNNNDFKNIGTRYGIDVFPYRKDGLYFSSKNLSPFIITKKNTPYLYLNDFSGIYMVNGSTDNVQNGFLINVNKNLANVSIGAIQLWINYKNEFSQTPTRIFNIDGKNQTIEFVVIADPSGQRGVIYARDAFTKTTLTNMKFYQNGVYTNNPIIFNNEWVCIGVSFDDVVSMSQHNGSINLFGGAVFNNISYYFSNGLGRNENTIVRPWIRVLEDAAIFASYSGSNKGDYFNLSNERIKWNYWYVDIEDSDNNPLTVHRKWANVYLINQDPSYVVTPEDIYAAFTGTNINIVDDNSGIALTNDKIFTINEVSWSTSTDIPA